MLTPTLDPRSALPGRSSPLLVTLILVGWLAGCGNDEGSPPDSPSLEMNEPDVEVDPDTSASQPEVGPSDPLATDQTLRVLHSTHAWSAPRGPMGGDFADVWSTSRGYFALERGAHRPASLWYSEEGRAWSQVAISRDVSAIREVIAHNGEVYAFGAEVLASDDGQHFEPREIEGINAVDVLAARIFEDALYLSLRTPGFTSRIVRLDAEGITTVAENLPVLASDFIIDGNRLIVTEGSYHGGVYTGELGGEVWTPAHTPSHIVEGGLDLHLTPQGYLATSSQGVWFSEDGASFATTLGQRAAQAAIANDRLYFGTLEPWGYVAHVALEALAGDGANAHVSYLDPVHVDGFQLVSDGSSVVGAAMGAGLFAHEPGSDRMVNVSPLRRALQEVESVEGGAWVVGDGELFVAEDNLTENPMWVHLASDEHQFERIAALPGALFTLTRDNLFVPLFDDGSQWRMGQSVALGKGRASALHVIGDEVWAGFAPVTLYGEMDSALHGGGLFVADRFAERPTDWSQPDGGLPDLAPGRRTPPVYALFADQALAVVAGQGGIFRYAGDEWVGATDDANLNAYALHNGQVWLAGTPGGIYLATTTQSGSELRRSLDGGSTWELVRSGSPLGRITTMAALEGALLIANESGVFNVSSDGILMPLGASSPAGRIEALTVNGSTILAAGSHGLQSIELESY